MLLKLEDKKLEGYIKRLLNKKEDYQLKYDDLKNINTLKLSKNIFNNEKELKTALEIFAKHGNIDTLTLSGINIGPEEISMLNRLTSLRTLVINNAKINIGNERLDVLLEKLTIVGCTGKDAGKLLSNESSENLEYVNISDNKDLSKEDLERLIENAENLTTLTLDGNEKLGKIQKPKRVKEFSQEAEYRPIDRSWSGSDEDRESERINANQFRVSSNRQIDEKSAKKHIVVTAEDLKTPEGIESIKKAGKDCIIDLQLGTTADLNMEQLENLEKSFDIGNVYVDTGWIQAKQKGYSYETYKAIKQEITDITKNIDPNLPEEQRYLEVRKILSENITYDDAALSAPVGSHDYYASRNLENALLSHTCVCAGYADVAKNIYAEMGIESKYVEGYTSKGEYHAWNVVKINGQWYQDDLTWDRGGKSKYALLNDAEMSKTHGRITYTDDGSIAPKCDAPTPNAVKEERFGTNQNKGYER